MRWGAILVSVAAVMLLAAAVYLAMNSERRLAHIDERNSADLATIAANLAQWPEVAKTIATQSAFAPESKLDAPPVASGSVARSPANQERVVTLSHPDFGRYGITYSRESEYDESSPAMVFTEAGLLRVSGEVRSPEPGEPNDDDRLPASLRPVAAGGDRLCYRMELPLDRLIRLGESAPGLKTILILDKDHVRQQIGSESLAIQSVADLRETGPRYGTILSLLSGANGKTGGKPDSGSTTGALAARPPFEAAIGAGTYRVYVHPLILRIGGNVESFAIVGVVDRRTMLFGGPRAPVSWIIVFILAFALLLALTPTLKLLLLGPVDAIAPIEVVAVALGLVVATAIATTSVALGAAVLLARDAADRRIAATALWMAHDIRGEVMSILSPDCPRGLPTSGCNRGETLSRATTPLRSERGATAAQAPVTPPDERPASDADPAAEKPYTVSLQQPRLAAALLPIDYDIPESAFVANRAGAQYSTLATVRDQAGGRASVAGRDYFDRLKNSDFLTIDHAHAFTAAGLTFTPTRFTIGRVLARPDGLMKTILTIPVDPPARVGADAPAGLSFAWVSKPLLAPVLPAGVSFLLVDLADPDLLVIAHSIPNRPQIEPLRRTLDRPGVARLDALAQARPTQDCAPVAADALVHFTARYDGRTRQFAAIGIPCTRWALLTNVDRDRLDALGAESALWALIGWSALFVTAAILGLLAWRLGRSPDPGRLWPDPRALGLYLQRRKMLHRLCELGAAATLIAMLALPLLNAAWIVALVVPLAATVILLRRLPAGAPGSSRLTLEVERAYSQCVFAALTCFAVVPLLALAIDAGHERTARDARAGVAEEARRLASREDRLLAVARAYYADIRDGAPFHADRAGWGGEARIGDYRFAGDAPATAHRSYTASLRALASPTGMPPPPRSALRPQTVDAPALAPRLTGYWGLLALAIGFAVLLHDAVRRTLIGLFGFGIPLKAVDYPEIPPQLWQAFGKRTMIVAAPDHTRKAIVEEPGIARIDLFKPIPPTTAGNVLITNLELVLKSDRLRLAALVLMEDLVEKQSLGTGRIVVLTSLSPLERLLHGYDRANDTADVYTDEEERERRRSFSEDREALRWSRLFEGFDTYYSQERPTIASVPDLPGSIPREQRAIARTVYSELDFLPLSVLETGLPKACVVTTLPQAAPPASPSDATTIASAREVGVEARKRDRAAADELKRLWAYQLSGISKIGNPAAGPRAVIDYFAALFIEHYQLAWSASSHGERLLLYHLARGRYLNIEKAYQLGPLVRRGLIMLDPKPRLLNRSFAQFIRFVENPATLARWRDTTPKGAWSRAQRPMILAIMFCVALLLVLAVQAGESIAAYVPILIGAGPALLHVIGLTRKPA
ncbi:MAG: hypothetical protein ABW182_01135 [Sphingomonas sp.]